MADYFVNSGTNSGATPTTPAAVSATYAEGAAGEAYDQLIQRAYDRYVEFALRSQVLMRSFADKKPVQQAMPGYAVTFSLYNDLPAATTPLVEQTDVEAASMDDVDQVSVILREYGNSVVNTRYSKETAFAEIESGIGNILAYNMADSIDKVVAAVLDSSTNVLDAGGTVDGSNIRTAVAKLRGDNVVPRNGTLYTTVMHPDVAFDLRNAEGPNTYEDVRKYGGPEDHILTQMVGTYGGTEVIESNRAPVAEDADGDATANAYSTFVLGRQALAEAVAVEPSVKLGPVVDRLSRFRPIGWHAILGFSLYRPEAMWKITSTSSIAGI
jgi:N4-gp56 family major capsid protein